MKFAIVNSNGVVEIRQDGSDILPVGGVELTDDQHAKMCSRELILVAGEIVVNPSFGVTI